MPKPTQGIDVDIDPSPYNAAYEYNYLYDYPIGMYPMYFPIRDTPNLPKIIYKDVTTTNTSNKSITTERQDYTVYYVFLIIAGLLAVLYFTSNIRESYRR